MPSASSGSVRVFYRRERSELIASIRRGLVELQRHVPLVEVVLFGSVATERHDAGSDVDLLIVHAGPDSADVFALAKRLIDVTGLEPHVYSEASARESADVLARMKRGGIPLYPDASATPAAGSGS
jgi:predicted nucleotidyltransferase